MWGDEVMRVHRHLHVRAAPIFYGKGGRGGGRPCGHLSLFTSANALTLADTDPFVPPPVGAAAPPEPELEHEVLMEDEQARESEPDVSSIKIPASQILKNQHVIYQIEYVHEECVHTPASKKNPMPVGMPRGGACNPTLVMWWVWV
jgi:hypothetical protein